MTSPQWLAADWPAPRGVTAGTTLRRGGVSIGPYSSLNLGAHVGDDPAAVRINRERFREGCGLPADPHWLQQVHGRRVLTDDAVRTGEPADAMVTGRSGRVCAVLTADCLPVVFASVAGDEIGVAHAGWRGLSAGILQAAVEAFKTPAPQLVAWLGPAISQAAFEVGDEVRHGFVQADSRAARHFRENDRGRWQADLYGLTRLALVQAGVAEIHGGGRCTVSEPDDFFSYRRDGECGRMATFVFRGDMAGRLPAALTSKRNNP